MPSRGWLALALVAGCEKESQPAPCVGETALDDAAVTCCDRSRRHVRIPWAELETLEIVTTDRGPAEEDLFWHFRAAGRECVVENGRIEATHLYDHLKALPGVTTETYRKIVVATGSTDNAKFPIWERSVPR